MLAAIRQWVIRTMMKDQTGVMLTLPKKDLVEFNVQMTAERLARNGINPQDLKNANQVENAINQIEAPRNVQQGIRNTESAKVIDMEGKEIPPGSKIMGGKQSETEAEILARINRENKKSVENIKNKMTEIDEAIDNASPGFAGDRKYDAQLVADSLAEKRFGKEFYDLDQKQQMQLYDEAYTGLSKQRFKQQQDLEKTFNKDVEEAGGMEEFLNKNPIDDDSGDFAQGGRAGFVAGGITNLAMRLARGFMKVTGRKPNDEEFMKIIREAAERDFAEVSDDVALRGVSETRATARRMDSINKDELRKVIDEYNMPVKTQKEFDFAQGGRAGFFMGSQFPKGAATLRQLLNFIGKKSDVVKNPSDILRISNPKAFNKMLEDAKGKIIPKEGIMATDRIKGYQTQMAKDRVDTVKDMLERGKRFKAADDKIVGYKNEVKERFMKDFNMSEEAAEKAANNMATFAMDMTKMEKTPKLTDEGLLQLENILKNMETGGKKSRDLNADGGRIGLKDGMNRRTFLKLLGGLASIPIIGKIIKPLKLATGVKKVPIIKTDNVAGKPEWFDALVNKVIIEGDDVTKRFATAERQSIHQKTLDDGSVVRVTEDIDDGAVRVEYENEANVFGDDVLMQYKKPLPDEGNPRPAAEFTTAESGPVSRQTGPDDFDLDVDEVGGSSIRDLDSDVSKLKEFATGQKPTMKEFVQNKKRKDKAKRITEDPEAQSDAVVRRQGEALDYDDYASGGIARMLGE